MSVSAPGEEQEKRNKKSSECGHSSLLACCFGCGRGSLPIVGIGLGAASAESASSVLFGRACCDKGTGIVRDVESSVAARLGPRCFDVNATRRDCRRAHGRIAQLSASDPLHVRWALRDAVASTDGVASGDKCVGRSAPPAPNKMCETLRRRAGTRAREASTSEVPEAIRATSDQQCPRGDSGLPHCTGGAQRRASARLLAWMRAGS